MPCTVAVRLVEKLANCEIGPGRDLHRQRGRIKLPHVARILEMIEEGFAVQGLSLFFIMQLDTDAL